MHKGVALLLALLLMTVSLCAYAEGDAFVMAGYDSESSGHIWDDNLFFRRMEERSGVVFTFKQSREPEDWQEQLNAMLKNKSELPDVLFKAELTPQMTQALYNAGVLIDLKPYLADNAPNLSALLAAHPEWEKAITLPGGQIAALPGINELQNTNAIWINTNWLQSIGKEKPTTADELLAVLRAFKNDDPNRNAKRDEIPMTFTSFWDLRFLGSGFGLCANDYYLSADDEGKVSFAADSQQMRDFVQWLNVLWEEKLIDHNGFSTLDTARAITDTNATFTYGVTFGPSVMQMLPTSAVSSYSVLMPMTYEGKAVYRDLMGDVVRGTFAVTSACKDPAAMVRWVDYLYGTEGEILAQAGVQDEEFTMLSDGSWSWLDDANTVANTVLKDVVIVGGGSMPGLASVDFQLRYDDETAHAAVEQLYALKLASRYPYPLVYLSAAQQERVNAIWAEMGPYVEQTLVHFVTSDLELNDENWAEFCAKVNAMGKDEFVSIWQEAIR